MRKSTLLLLVLVGMLLMTGCSTKPAAHADVARSPQPTTALAPTPTPTQPPPSVCPQVPAAQPGQPPAAPPSVYVGRDGLAALNLSDGSVRWQDALDPDSGAWVASVADNVVYMSASYGNDQGILAALNASDGHLRWCIGLEPLIRNPFGAGWSQIAVDGQTVYSAGGEAGSLRAINVSNGSERWNAFPAGSIYNLTAANGRVYVSAMMFPSTPIQVMALDASDGQTAWSIQPKFIPIGQVVVGDGMLYTSEQGGQGNADLLDALNASDGSLRWSAPESQGLDVSQPVVDGDMVYVANDSGVMAFSASTGTKRWQGQPLGVEMVGPAAANGLVYVAWVNGAPTALQYMLTAFNGSAGQQQWQIPLSETVPGAQLSPQLRPALPQTFGRLLNSLEVIDGVVVVSYIASSANGSADVIATFNAQTGQRGWSTQGLLWTAG